MFGEARLQQQLMTARRSRGISNPLQPTRRNDDDWQRGIACAGATNQLDAIERARDEKTGDE
jgi:hypothetical protein